jgi:NhaP-type Na+/H+ or K+/H+ antiporter
MYDTQVITMGILLALFTGMTSELLIRSWRGRGGREESVEAEVITYAAFFCIYLY